jgi:hypothetical protein
MTEPTLSIGKLGFRRCYERWLIESHAWLESCYLCALGIAASLDGVSFYEAERLGERSPAARAAPMQPSKCSATATPRR